MFGGFGQKTGTFEEYIPVPWPNFSNMADQEINSFFWKFKYLCAAGCQAALEFKSDGGCVSIMNHLNF